MTTHSLLVAARALITDPAKWTRGTFARDANGETVAPRDTAAVCWCSIGALNKCRAAETAHTNDPDYRAALKQLDDVAMHHGNSIIFLNDRPEWDHWSVMTVWDAAIAAVEETT
jgi:hypothetical protein